MHATNAVSSLHPAADDEGRPIHLLKASLPRIKEFIRGKLPEEDDTEGDVQMAES